MKIHLFKYLVHNLEILQMNEYNKGLNWFRFVKFRTIPIKQLKIKNKYTLNKYKHKFICTYKLWLHSLNDNV